MRIISLVSIVVLAMGFAKPIGAVPRNRHLPYMAGEIWWCSQDWLVCPGTHCNERAWDFNWGSGSADLGMPLLAPADGTIEYAGNTGTAYGIVVLIRYGDGSLDRIAHCLGVVVRKGETVKQGQVVAFCGLTGSTAVHIHVNAQSSTSPSASGTYSVASNFYYRKGSTDYYGRPTGCNCSSSPPSSVYYTSRNSGVFDREFSANGKSSTFGSIQYTTNTYRGIHWWHGWNPSELYGTQNTARRCYIQDYNGGSWGACAIVYDALGGARKAYTVRTGFWRTGYGNGWSERNGPQGDLGMPVTNEYANGTNAARQDFQRGYLHYKREQTPREVTVNPYPFCGPGMTSAGWNTVISYKVARLYEQGGARNYYGEASGYAAKVSGTTNWRQYFNRDGVQRSITVAENTTSSLSSPLPDPESELQARIQLRQNHPNPCNPVTTIGFTLPEQMTVNLAVYDVQGRPIAVLVNGPTEAGDHEVTWHGRDISGNPIASGVYFYRLQAGKQIQTKKLVLLK